MSLAKVGKFTILHQVFIRPGIISSLVLRLWWLKLWNIFLQSHRSLRLHFLFFQSVFSLYFSLYNFCISVFKFTESFLCILQFSVHLFSIFYFGYFNFYTLNLISLLICLLRFSIISDSILRGCMILEIMCQFLLGYSICRLTIVFMICLYFCDFATSFLAF